MKTLKETTAEERFWKKVDKRGPDDCWLWFGGANKDNVGKLYLGIEDSRPKYTTVYKFSFKLANGPIPEGLEILHTCDVRYAKRDTRYRRCVNPSHMRVGTHSENLKDMAAKRRGRGELSEYGKQKKTVLDRDRVASPKHRPGTHGRYTKPSKLTPEQAIALRELRKTGKTLQECADHFGISRTQAFRIVNGQRWIYV
jgi:hypothetical protein